jgi:hypothetical protein
VTVPDNKLSAKEAALIAQARAGLERTPAERPAAAAMPARAEPAPAPAADAAASTVAIEKSSPNGATPDPSADPAERIAALLAAARAESEGRRQRQRRIYVWAPVAFVSMVGLWTLLWLWHRL